MTKTIQVIDLEPMSPGTKRQLKAHRYGKKGARPKAYLQASLHADEIPGMLAAHHLLRLLDEADSKGDITGEIVVVPVANPIGAGQILNTHFVGRYDFRSGLNFNRRWPDLFQGLEAKVAGKLGKDAHANVAAVRHAMGEIAEGLYAASENQAMRKELIRLAYDSDFILDMHCDDEALLHVYTTKVYWPNAIDLAGDLGAHAVMLSDDSGVGSFDESFSAPWIKLQKALGNDFPMPIPCLTATLEFRGQADVNDDFAKADARALFNFLQRRGLIRGVAVPAPAFAGEVAELDECEILRAPRAGVIAYRRRPGDRVKKGELIAELVNPMADDANNARTEVRCKASGLMLSRRMMKAIGAGDGMGMIVGHEKLPNPSGLVLFD
jgi:predicted deacylase